LGGICGEGTPLSQVMPLRAGEQLTPQAQPHWARLYWSWPLSCVASVAFPCLGPYGWISPSRTSSRPPAKVARQGVTGAASPLAEAFPARACRLKKKDYACVGPSD